MLSYVADFETTKEKNNTKARVWLYGVCQIGNPDNFFWGLDIKHFMDWCRTKGNKTIYFHNLKFDGEFIIHWLLKNGYTYDEEKNDKTFNTLISKQGQFYQIEVIFKRYNKRYWKVTFLDSHKKLPFPVKTIAEAFHLDMMKGDIDHDKKRPLGYQPTTEEIDYVKNDVQIVAKALNIQFDQGLKKMTNGSDALNDFKERFGKKNFERHFPVLPLPIDKDIRGAYRGGFTYLNDKYKEKDVGKGVVFDVNSLYPAVMYNKLLPYGKPIPFKGEYKHDHLYPLYIQHLRCVFTLKENKIPTIQIKGLHFNPTEYLKDSDNKETELIVTNIDLELIKEHYHLEDVEYLGGHKFKGATGLFKEYIDHWHEVKSNNKGAIRQLAKLMLNSLYGKFATNPDVTGKYPYLDEDDIVRYTDQDEQLRDPIYTPLGVFITSWARYVTITSAQKEYHRFIYADTDSLHLEGEEMPKNIEIDSDKLGAWDHEGTFEKARFIRQKSYIEVFDGKLKVTCAGMPDNVKEHVTWDNFRSGLQIDGKLQPKRVVGGVILQPTTYTLKG